MSRVPEPDKLVDSIESLTPEQEARLPEIRAEWTQVGICTDPADRPRAEAGARLAYELNGAPLPEFYVWLDSPLAGCIGAAILSAWDGPGQWNKRSGPMTEQARIVSESIVEQTGLDIGGWYPSEADLRAQLNMCGWGQHDTWLSFCAAFREFGLRDAVKLDGLFEIGRSSGWWWPFDRAVILTERPSSLSFDVQERLHCENGPALLYPDGFSLYVWHGTRVPRTLIDPGWSPTQILREPDQEIRRCAVERIGWDKFIDEAKLTPVGKPIADPGNPGQDLFLYDVPSGLYGQPVRVLLCTNGTIERDGTRRQFGLTVPASISTPLEAAAWTYNCTPEEYAQLEVRR